jgi:hypothetical protein
VPYERGLDAPRARCSRHGIGRKGTVAFPARGAFYQPRPVLPQGPRRARVEAVALVARVVEACIHARALEMCESAAKRRLARALGCAPKEHTLAARAHEGAHVGSRHVGSRLPRAPSLCQTGGSGAARHRARNGRLCFRGLFAGSGFGLLTVRQAKLRSGGCHVSPYKAET